MEFLKKLFAWILDFLAGKKLPLPELPGEKPEPVLEPVPAPPAPFESLKNGSKGDAVSKAQQRLKELGFWIDVDGDFGDATEAVVKSFQEANQIGKTGIIGPQTASVLFSAKAKGPIQVSSGMIAAAQLARKEAQKELKWTATGEAEKYLSSVRDLIGMPSGRFPWCAAFVFWCMKQCGIDMSILGAGAAYVPSWVAWAKNKGYWHLSTEKSFTPRLGDIVIYDWDNVGTLDPEHIGFVLSYDGGSYIQAAEGNTSAASNGNGNSTAVRTRHWDLIEGFIRIP